MNLLSLVKPFSLGAVSLTLATAGAVLMPLSAQAGSFYSYTEDFEDGALNTPGVTASGGFVLNSGSLTDSVQGANPGFGSTGRSFYSNGARMLRFTFNKAVLGLLPTTAGITWTDVGFVGDETTPGPFTGKGNVNFRAFDANNALLTSISEFLGDGKVTGETAEDKIFSYTNLAGIAAIEIEMDNSGDWEVDNLSYSAIPTPALLPGLIGLGLGAWRKRKGDQSEQAS